MQQKMDGFEKPAPELPWDKVDEALAANRRRATMRTVWGRRAAAAALAALVAMGGYMAFRGDDASDDARTAIAEQKTTTPEAPRTRASSPATKPESADDGQRTTPRARMSSPATEPLSTDNDQRIAQNKLTAKNRQTVRQIQPTASDAGEDAHAPGDNRQEKLTAIDAGEDAHTPSDSTARKKTVTVSTMEWPEMAMTSASDDSRLTANLYLGNALHGAAGNGMLTVANQGKNMYDAPIMGSTYNMAGETDQPKEKVSHHQPFRLGLSLRYQFNDRWSIDGGLAYTRVTTDITTEIKGQKWQTEQRLTYIGIPVGVNYLLWGNRHVAFYAGAGAMAEKMVKGSWQTEGKQTKVTIRPLQFSVNGAVGAEYRFTPQLSLYAEPTLGYYFDNGSKVPTYYKDKPLHLDLSLGLRWSIK